MQISLLFIEIKFVLMEQAKVGKNHTLCLFASWESYVEFSELIKLPHSLINLVTSLFILCVYCLCPYRLISFLFPC